MLTTANTMQRPLAEKRPFRLLVVSSDTYPPTRVDVSVLFGEELASRGHRIDWILQSEAHCQKSYVVDWGGGKVWVGATDLQPSLLSRVRKHVTGIFHDLKLFHLLRTGNYDLIEVKDKFISGVFAAFAARRYRKRFVYWLSYPFPEDYLYRAKQPGTRYPLLYRVRGSTFKFLLYRVILPAADHVFVQSKQMLCDVAAEGVPESKMTVVPMGVRGGNATPPLDVELRRVIPRGEKCFLYLGTLAKVRRLDFLIRVLAHVLKEIPEAKLYFVGRGDDLSDEQVLLDEAKKMNVLFAVVFIGQLPQAQALEFVREADVCVSPFYPAPVLNSTSPTKLVEYMAMGKAVVANDHPEQRLVIDQSGGGFCVPYEEKAFARAILKLLSTPEMARTMGARGQAYVQKHRTYTVIADLVEQQLLTVSAKKMVIG